MQPLYENRETQYDKAMRSESLGKKSVSSDKVHKHKEADKTTQKISKDIKVKLEGEQKTKAGKLPKADLLGKDKENTQLKSTDESFDDFMKDVGQIITSLMQSKDSSDQLTKATSQMQGLAERYQNQREFIESELTGEEHKLFAMEMAKILGDNLGVLGLIPGSDYFNFIIKISKNLLTVASSMQLQKVMENTRQTIEAKKAIYGKSPNPDLKEEISELEHTLSSLEKQSEGIIQSVVGGNIPAALKEVGKVVGNFGKMSSLSELGKLLSETASSITMSGAGMESVIQSQKMYKHLEAIQNLIEERKKTEEKLDKLTENLAKLETLYHTSDDPETYDAIIAHRNAISFMEVKLSYLNHVQLSEKSVALLGSLMKSLTAGLSVASSGAALAGATAAVTAGLATPIAPLIVGSTLIAGAAFLAAPSREILSSLEIINIEKSINKTYHKMQAEMETMEKMTEIYQALSGIGDVDKQQKLQKEMEGKLELSQKQIDKVSLKFQKLMESRASIQESIEVEKHKPIKANENVLLAAEAIQKRVHQLEAKADEYTTQIDEMRGKLKELNEIHTKLAKIKKNPLKQYKVKIAQSKKRLHSLEAKLKVKLQALEQAKEDKIAKLRADVMGASDELFSEWKESFEEVLSHPQSAALILNLVGCSDKKIKKMSGNERFEAAMGYIEGKTAA